MRKETQQASIEYLAAVELAVGCFEQWNETDHVWDMIGGEAAAHLLRKDPETYLAWAAAKPKGFDTVRTGIAQLLERGEELSPQLMAWLVAHLRGQVSRPKAKTGRNPAGWMHTKICLAIQRLVDAGMTATRNDASPPNSACDAVADALDTLGLEPKTFERVKSIWLRWQRERSRRHPIDPI